MKRMPKPSLVAMVEAGSTKIDERKFKGKVEEKRTIKRGDVTKESSEDPIPELEQKLIAA